MKTETAPLGDFAEGQWWVVELDRLAADIAATPDQKRAVAVVRHLLRAAKAATLPWISAHPDGPVVLSRSDWARGDEDRKAVIGGRDGDIVLHGAPGAWLDAADAKAMLEWKQACSTPTVKFSNTPHPFTDSNYLLGGCPSCGKKDCIARSCESIQGPQ